MPALRPALVAALAVTVLAARAFGPPQITVTEVRGNPPVPGAVLLVEGHHHTDEPEADLSARAITIRDGRRVERPVALTRYGAVRHYAVTRQWDGGQAWLLVFTIKQGVHRELGTAESFVKVDAGGRVVAIEKVMERNARGDRYPRGATAAEVNEALRGLGLLR